MRMNVFEMEGFLRGKCVPRDLKVNETNAEYLVRKFDALEAKWICPYISRHLLSLNPLLACCRRYSRGER